MTGDPNKKSARTFQCRDVLWETFEQMAKELECSIDYLVNEAMKQYARQRSYGGATRTPLPGGPPSSGGQAAGAPPPMPAAQRPSAAPPPPPPAKPRPSLPPQQPGARPPLPPPPGGVGAAPPPPARMPLPPPPAPARPAPPPPMPMAAPPPMPMAAPMPMPAPMPPAPPPMPGYGAPAARASAPPPLPGGMRQPAPPPAHPGAARVLVALYQGERTPVNKDRFIIGRGKQTSDLTIKDPNVSRQHAMVEFLNGQYYMVDMGSTNGVEYMGQRIARKVIVEGDSYRICDHEVRFTYQ